MNRRQTQELLFKQAAENDWAEPILPNAAMGANVGSKCSDRKSYKINVGFTESYGARISMVSVFEWSVKKGDRF
jgi:hypothetical protein